MRVPSAESVTWKRSTRCSSSDCVEIARVGDAVLVRDSKDATGANLSFGLAEWQSFLAGVRLGEFDTD
jgi:hypothetical protein